MSEIKVNKISPRTACGTVQLGDSGDTITIPAGATITNSGTQTGFGREGSVNWQTSIKTGDFTGVSGEGYFINTTSGEITLTLPSSPSAGAIVAFKDYANTWDCNAVTLCRNGSKINGQATNATLDTESQSVTLIYVDDTKGWQDIQDSTANVTGASFTSATGGTITTCGDFKIHTFTSDANFVVSNVGNTAGGGDKVSYVVVAGGGGGNTGGGGAGGFREGKNTPKDSYTASPLAAACSGLSITAATFPITVGGGGAASGPSPAANGSNSIFSSITSTGGGASGGPPGPGNPGGSGGGANQAASIPNPARPASGGSGNTPPVSPPQGNAGGSTATFDQTGGGGGGGATAVGANSVAPPAPNSAGLGGAGGAGATSSITGSPVARAGGGGGSQYNPSAPSTPVSGGTGGGGSGGLYGPGLAGGAGTANTGGGGGGGPNAGAGGSGVVIIRYKFQ